MSQLPRAPGGALAFSLKAYTGAHGAGLDLESCAALNVYDLKTGIRQILV